MQLEKPVSARYIRLTNYKVADGKFAVSGLRIFGEGNGDLPQAINHFKVTRNQEAKRSVKLEWEKVPGVVGYNIRYGVHPDKLYLNYQVYGESEVLIKSLNVLEDYYSMIDAFIENAFVKGEKVISSGSK